MAFADLIAGVDDAVATHLGDDIVWRPQGGGAHALRALPQDTAGQTFGVEGMNLNTQRDAWQVRLSELATVAPGRRLAEGDGIEFVAGPRAGAKLIVYGTPRVEDAEGAWLTFEVA